MLHENIVGSNLPTSYSWPSWSGRTGWGDHTLLRLLIYHSTPSIYLSYLTLYKGQCLARNIYTRNMALSIFLWLYKYFCLSIFGLCYFKIVFFQTFPKPLYSSVPDSYNLRSLPGGRLTFTPMLFWSLGASCSRMAQSRMWGLTWNGIYMMRQLYRYVHTILHYSSLFYYHQAIQRLNQLRHRRRTELWNYTLFTLLSDQFAKVISGIPAKDDPCFIKCS